jgi:hypothetical protein
MATQSIIVLLPKHNNIWSYPSQLPATHLGLIRSEVFGSVVEWWPPPASAALVGRRPNQQIDSIFGPFAASYIHLRIDVHLPIHIHDHGHFPLHADMHIHVHVQLHVHPYVGISHHLHILKPASGIFLSFMFIFIFCFLFFVVPLRLHRHSTTQVQSGHPIADPIPSSFGPSVAGPILIVTYAMAVKSRDLLSSFSVSLSDLQQNGTNRSHFFLLLVF